MPNVSIVSTVMITVCSTTYTVAASWNLLSMYTQGDQEKPTYPVVVSSIHVCVCVYAGMAACVLQEYAMQLKHFSMCVLTTCVY